MVSTARSGWTDGDIICTLPTELQPYIGGWLLGVASDGTSCQLNLAYGTRRLTYTSGFGSTIRRLRTTFSLLLDPAAYQALVS